MNIPLIMYGKWKTCHYAKTHTIHRLQASRSFVRSSHVEHYTKGRCDGEDELKIEKHHTPNIIEVLCYIHFYTKQRKSHKTLFLQFQALFIRFLLYCFRW